MFERFNESARRVLFFSRQEAGVLGDNVIDSEHLLLGLLHEPDAIVTELLEVFDVDPARLRAQFPVPDATRQIASSAEMPLTEHAVEILDSSTAEADRMGDVLIRPHALLMAMLRLRDSHAAMLLAAQGMIWSKAAEAAQPIVRRLSELRERRELTPILLLESHYEMLDKIAERIGISGSRQVTRQELSLAFFEAVTATGFSRQSFESVDQLVAILRDYLQARWPAA